ncbi:MAG: sugar O-acetyltransferase [Verrucomicrobiaceae bacterium]|nr:sugar O-acetyltransferase [Verrucomicrobiaceae bacterium]
MSSIRTEKEKMLAGELYDPLDPQLSAERHRCRDLCKVFNDSREDQTALRKTLLDELMGGPTDVWIQPPFFCDYGTNIRLGSKVFFNFNCVVLDVMEVTIGNNVLFGPSVQIYAATHPMNPVVRREWKEFAKPVTIGDDVWVGGGAIICPGVTIGDRTVIGAGSVVTRDIPADVFAAGNPCRVIRPIEKQEAR